MAKIHYKQANNHTKYKKIENNPHRKKFGHEALFL
jgi:hypothetical protein